MNIIRSRIKNWILYETYKFMWLDKGNQAIVLRSILGIYSKEVGK